MSIMETDSIYGKKSLVGAVGVSGELAELNLQFRAPVGYFDSAECLFGGTFGKEI